MMWYLVLERTLVLRVFASLCIATITWHIFNDNMHSTLYFVWHSKDSNYRNQWCSFAIFCYLLALSIFHASIIFFSHSLIHLSIGCYFICLFFIRGRSIDYDPCFSSVHPSSINSLRIVFRSFHYSSIFRPIVHQCFHAYCVHSFIQYSCGYDTRYPSILHVIVI